jgi:hypothetical protein
MSRILFGCPQCGAQIDSLEEEHVVRCRFCSSVLLASTPGGVPGYSLAPKIQDPRRAREMILSCLSRKGLGQVSLPTPTLTHLPFWRLKAVSYRWFFGSRAMGKPDPNELFPPPSEKAKELVVRPLDHTIAASRKEGIGMKTLGTRAQVLPLSPLGPADLQGPLMPVEVSRLEAMEALQRLGQSVLQPKGLTPEIVLESLVGVRLSLIFSPLWHGTAQVGETEHHIFLDAIDGQELGEATSGGALGKSPAQKAPQEPLLGRLEFLPFRCPNCGWDLPFRPQSLLHLCPTCLRLWDGQEGRWKEIPYQAAAPPQGQAWEELLWVPFWCIQCRFSDGKTTLDTASELCRLAPQSNPMPPRTVRDGPCLLYVPATRLPDPKVTLAMAVRVTGAQPGLELTGFPQGAGVRSAGASLPRSDAGHMATAVLAGLVPFRNKRLLEWLGRARAQLGEAKVVFLPFSRKDIFWKELHTQATFPHSPQCPDLILKTP